MPRPTKQVAPAAQSMDAIAMERLLKVHDALLLMGERMSAEREGLERDRSLLLRAQMESRELSRQVCILRSQVELLERQQSTDAIHDHNYWKEYAIRCHAEYEANAMIAAYLKGLGVDDLPCDPRNGCTHCRNFKAALDSFKRHKSVCRK